MKAESKVTLFKVLSAALLAAAPLLSSGCIAQAGTGTEDPGSTTQDLSATAAPGQKTALPSGNQQRSLAEQFTQTTVLPGGAKEFSTPPPGADPGTPIENDGNEPDPVPWNPQRVVSVKH
jgi:hypothetical protein